MRGVMLRAQLMDNRSAQKFRYSVPTREQVREKLYELQKGNITVEEVSNWATEYVLFDDPQIYPEIEDPLVWETICKLSGSDSRISEGTYLYSGEDFERWLAEFEKKCSNDPTAT